jgi:hypothetical protein
VNFRIFTVLLFLGTTYPLLAQLPAQPGLNAPAQSDEPDDKEGDKKLKKRNSKGSLFLNDSAKLAYGPKSTLRITEEDLFYNRLNYRPIDTTIFNMHRWGYVQRFNYQYQDLGIMGTALNPIFPQVRNFSGAVSGFNSYRLYFDTQEPYYYDTKSPFARVNLVWGGLGRAMTHVEFSRNINPRWNFGFNYRPILVDKQLQRQRKGDRLAIGQYYDFHTSYKSKDSTYLLLFNFRRTRHRVFETGGVKIAYEDDFSEYFNREASPRMVAAETSQFLRNYHFFNQYTWVKGIQLYGTLDWTRETNYFVNNYSREQVEFTDPLFDNWERVFPDKFDLNQTWKKATKGDSTKAYDQLRFSTFKSETGIKGRAGFLFYNVYYKFRSYSLYQNHANSLIRLAGVIDGSAANLPVLDQNNLGLPSRLNSKGVEHYLGGRLSFDVDSLTRLSGMAEINQLGNYSVDARFTSKIVDATFVQSISRPGFIYTGYRGTHDFWTNNFKNITGLKIEGFLKTPFKKILIAPGLTYTLLNNYVYFRKDDYDQRQTVLPVQATSVINLANPQLKWGVNVTKGIRLSGNVIHNLILSDDNNAIKAPDWLVNSQFALEDFWFKKNLQVHIGMDVTWRSAYNAMGYDIPTQQYYVQNEVMVDNALIVDPFLNAKIKRGRFWFTYHNLLQVITRTGYIITPGYPGQRSVFDLGFELIMFD